MATERRQVRIQRLIGSAAAALVSLGVPTAAHAQSRIWFASAHYESPALVVPIVFVTSHDQEREWRFAVAGWSLSGEWKASLAEKRRLHLVSRITPFNANSSNYVYREGERDHAAEYQNASFEAGGGLEIDHTRHWTGGYRLIALYESVDGVAPELESYWERPFGGIEVTQRYTRITSDELFGTRWEGVKLGVDARLFTGTRTWSQFQARVGAGRRRGRLFMSGRAEVFAGKSLNNVSVFLIGGSWDLAVPGFLTGYRYGEFRLDRAAVLAGALDLRVAGSWELGTRTGCLAARNDTECGVAVQAMTIWNGAVVKVGAAIPLTASGSSERRTVLFASLAVAVIDR